jgi:hypothetical protein
MKPGTIKLRIQQKIIRVLPSLATHIKTYAARRAINTAWYDVWRHVNVRISRLVGLRVQHEDRKNLNKKQVRNDKNVPKR